MQPVIESTTDHTVANMVFADGVRRVVLVIDRALARERLAPRILGQAAAHARDAAALEIQVAEVAESLGWSVRAERGAFVNVLTVGVA
jgi:hypothetical protein